MGSMINLPVINYYEHATFFTGGHAHGAMFGVKGNIALASILYCVQHVVEPEDWCPNLVRTASRSMNGGIALMMVFVSMNGGIALCHFTLSAPSL
jgi:nitric oxide reductase subunit B